MCAGRQVEHRHLRGGEPASRGDDGHEHRPAARKHLGPEVIELAARRGGLRESADGAAGCRHALQARGWIRRGKNDRVVRCPGRPKHLPGVCDRHRRPTCEGHLLERIALHEPHPFAIRRGEDPVQRSGARKDRRRVEPIQRADEELIVATDVNDIASVGCHGHAATRGDIERRPARRRHRPCARCAAARSGSPVVR